MLLSLQFSQRKFVTFLCLKRVFEKMKTSQNINARFFSFTDFVLSLGFFHYNCLRKDPFCPFIFQCRVCQPAHRVANGGTNIK